MIPIASLTLDAQGAEGGNFELLFEIGAPYQGPEGEWLCPLSMKPLHNFFRGIGGSDAFQALCLALAMTREMLASHVEMGGRLRYQDEEGEFDFNSYFRAFSGAPAPPPAG
jgi:hypothetical protein